MKFPKENLWENEGFFFQHCKTVKWILSPVMKK